MRLAGVGEMTFRHPRRVRPRHEIHEVRVVNGSDRVEPEVRRRDNLRTGCDQAITQQVTTRRLLVTGFTHAEPVTTVRRMSVVTITPDHRHPQAHGRQI